MIALKLTRAQIRELSLQLALVGLIAIGALLALGATGSTAALVALGLVAVATAAESTSPPHTTSPPGRARL